jgi:hypothetical protein
MKDQEISKSFMKTNLYTPFGEFFVSTIYRRSSAAANPDGWYYETFGWSLENGKQNHIIADNSGAMFPRKAIEQHGEVCHQLFEKGVFVATN